MDNLKVSKNRSVHAKVQSTLSFVEKTLLPGTRKTLKKMSAIFHDRPMSALDKAVYWVEYVLNHKGTHHLHSAAIELTWYQYYLLDVITLLTSIAFFLICICYYIAKRSVIPTNDRPSKRMKIKKVHDMIIIYGDSCI